MEASLERVLAVLPSAAVGGVAEPTHTPAGARAGAGAEAGTGENSGDVVYDPRKSSSSGEASSGGGVDVDVDVDVLPDGVKHVAVDGDSS